MSKRPVLPHENLVVVQPRLEELGSNMSINVRYILYQLRNIHPGLAYS